MFVPTPSRESRSIPPTISAVPTMGKALYRPERVMSWPLPIEATSTPSISGRSCRPDWVGLSPFTTCR